MKTYGKIFDRFGFAASHKDWDQFAHCWGNPTICPTDIDAAIEIEGYTLMIEHKLVRPVSGPERFGEVQVGQLRAYKTWARFPGWAVTVLVVWAEPLGILLGRCPHERCRRKIVHPRGIGDAEGWALIEGASALGVTPLKTSEERLKAFCKDWAKWARGGGALEADGRPHWVSYFTPTGGAGVTAAPGATAPGV